MQQIFLVSATPKEYHAAGRDFPFPKPSSCLNPSCLKPIPPKPHGFYQRNFIDKDFIGVILIRRYYCPHCGMTFSYLPSFCLPYYQYSLFLIYKAIYLFCVKNLPHGKIVKMFSSRGYHGVVKRQHLAFYVARFRDNLKAVQLFLRSFLSVDIYLPEEVVDKKEKAKKVLDIVKNGFREIHAFSQRFFAQYQRSFLASCKLF